MTPDTPISRPGRNFSTRMDSSPGDVERQLFGDLQLSERATNSVTDVITLAIGVSEGAPLLALGASTAPVVALLAVACIAAPAFGLLGDVLAKDDGENEAFHMVGNMMSPLGSILAVGAGLSGHRNLMAPAAQLGAGVQGVASGLKEAKESGHAIGGEILLDLHSVRESLDAMQADKPSSVHEPPSEKRVEKPGETTPKEAKEAKEAPKDTKAEPKKSQTGNDTPVKIILH